MKYTSELARSHCIQVLTCLLSIRVVCVWAAARRTEALGLISAPGEVWLAGPRA